MVARRWSQVHPGVYATFSGTVSDRAKVWAAVLKAGPDAVAGHRTALWLAGALDELPAVIEVVIPHGRKAQPGEGMRVHRMRHLAELTHPAASPPRLRLEPALLAVTNAASSAESVIDLVLRAAQRRLTTAPRLVAAVKAWPRHRWRSLLLELLSEVEDGITSALELRYARHVERAHGLPAGRRNQPETDAEGRKRYRDVRYEGYDTVVELDGREAHPMDQAFRDLRRDNALVVAGGQGLRYGWRDVACRPCLIAAQMAQVLRRNGWTGQLHPCAPTCPVTQGSG
jgi:hypothetical protein